ncbi:hypothetical protein ATCC90586_004849 [Pythium insidiosum]|nr:hypothetical protein ATCC90586_004849 [Pythium insidiosum]
MLATSDTVRWVDSALQEEVRRIALASSRLYQQDPDSLVSAIEQVLQVDVRSRDLTRRRDSASLNHLVLDVVRVGYVITSHQASVSIDITAVASGEQDAANVAGLPAPMTPSRNRHPKRSRQAIAAGIHSKKKKRKKQSAVDSQVTASHPCFGLYVDAMDSKLMWAEARIIDCDPEEERIKITFIGWPRKWDMWTDQFSIRPHGSIVLVKPIKPSTKALDNAAAKPSKLKGKDGHTPADIERKRAKQRSDINANSPKRLTVRISKSAPSPPPSSTWSRVLRQDRRLEVQDDMNKTNAFLVQCAGVWRQQYLDSLPPSKQADGPAAAEPVT